MPHASGLVHRVQLITVPSSDQDRSVAFYEGIGFEKRADFPWGEGHRWIEMYPPDTPTGIAVIGSGTADGTGVNTGIILNTDDIDEAHARFRSLGVDVDAAVARVGGTVPIRLGPVETTDPVPPMFWFRDPDGNALLVVQPG